MEKIILLNIESLETRYAELQNGRLSNLVIERKSSRSITGNIYRGKVISMLKSASAFFVDFGGKENGFIPDNDANENAEKYADMVDAEGSAGISKQEDVKVGQNILVQVVKESIGTKGAKLTSRVSLAGRYFVLLPNTPLRGVSRKIENREEREKLKKLLKTIEIPKDVGLICRTASVEADPELCRKEAHDLYATWEQIWGNFQKAKGPKLLYEEAEILKRSLITAIDKNFNRIIVDDENAYKDLLSLKNQYPDSDQVSIELHKAKLPLFEHFKVEGEIEKALGKKIMLPSGGHLIFEQTEAMHTIDVNSGRSRATAEGKIEENFVKINLEAAEEVARQLRIRNLGGLIIIDFIDMRLQKNHKRVLTCLKTAMKDDRARCTMLGISEFGLVEMTRQRNRESLYHLIYRDCPYCVGRGRIKSDESTLIDIERAFKRFLPSIEPCRIELIIHPHLKEALTADDKERLCVLAEKHGFLLKFSSADTLHLNSYKILSDKGITLIDG